MAKYVAGMGHRNHKAYSYANRPPGILTQNARQLARAPHGPPSFPRAPKQVNRQHGGSKRPFRWPGRPTTASRGTKLGFFAFAQQTLAAPTWPQFPSRLDRAPHPSPPFGSQQCGPRASPITSLTNCPRLARFPGRTSVRNYQEILRETE